MKTDFIPFHIGMDYEHWEFDLEFLEDLYTCEKYKYIKNDILEVLDNPIEVIYLYFNCDVLVRVDLEFQNLGSHMIFLTTVGTLEEKLGQQVLSVNSKNTLIQKLWEHSEKLLAIQHDITSNTIKLVLTKREYLEF